MAIQTISLWLVDLNYNFEFNWLIVLSNNNLESELVENRSFFKPITIEEIVVLWLSMYNNSLESGQIYKATIDVKNWTWFE